MLDKIIIQCDKALKILFDQPLSVRPHPDQNILEASLTDAEKKHIIGLMRVNHCGEICAQGLYQGQAITANDEVNKIAFEQAALEEIEHLAWTRQRIVELGGNPSIFDPVFYFGSLMLGISAGILGDKWNLAFLEETENQVENHLAKHLTKLPEADKKSQAIIMQMKLDEAKHALMAHEHGAAELPKLVKQVMQVSAKVMTSTTYHI